MYQHIRVICNAYYHSFYNYRVSMMNCVGSSNFHGLDWIQKCWVGFQKMDPCQLGATRACGGKRPPTKLVCYCWNVRAYSTLPLRVRIKLWQPVRMLIVNLLHIFPHNRLFYTHRYEFFSGLWTPMSCRQVWIILRRWCMYSTTVIYEIKHTFSLVATNIIIACVEFRCNG